MRFHPSWMPWTKSRKFTLSSKVRPRFFFSDHRCADSVLSTAVVILAFKAVYTLEKKRRENDQRVLALYAECVPPVSDPSPLSHKC